MKRIRLTEAQLHRLIEQALNDQKFEPNDSRKRAPQTRYVGQSTKDLDGNILRRKSHNFSESLARRVTESVVRRLNEWDDNVDDMFEFDNAKDAYDFVMRHKNGNEELFLNGGSLTFGLGDVATEPDIGREFMESPEGKEAKMRQGANDAFLDLSSEATLLEFLEWLQDEEGYLCFITNSDEDGKPRPVENYLW